MENIQKIKKPTVSSYLSAQMEADEWTRQNEFDNIIDKDGLEWTLNLTHEELPSLLGDSLQWNATFAYKARSDAAAFIRTKVLDPVVDERLICLLGEDEMALMLKPTIIQASNSDELKTKLSQSLFDFKKKLSSSNLRDLKRGLIGRWIDSQRQFM